MMHIPSYFEILFTSPLCTIILYVSFAEGLPYRCEICDEELGSKHNYKMHKINVHSAVSRTNFMSHNQAVKVHSHWVFASVIVSIGVCHNLK